MKTFLLALIFLLLFPLMVMAQTGVGRWMDLGLFVSPDGAHTVDVLVMPVANPNRDNFTYGLVQIVNGATGVKTFVLFGTRCGTKKYVMTGLYKDTDGTIHHGRIDGPYIIKPGTPNSKIYYLLCDVT